MPKNSEEKIPYLSDGELYSIWKYLNGFRLVKRSGVLNFDDLTPSGENRLFIAKFLSLLKELGIDSLEGLIFHKNIYLQHHKNGYEELKKKKEEGTLNGFSLKHLEFLEEIFENPATLYRNDVGFFDFVLYEGKLGTLEFFEFSAKLPPKDKKKLDGFIKNYVKNFIIDNLQKDKNNFYCFKEQRKRLSSDLHFKEMKYGRSFIFEYPSKSDDLFGPDKEYLFIHTLIALEISDYLEIENIWIFDMDLPPEKQTENYKVKINLKDKFFEEKDEIIYGISKKDEKSLFVNLTKKTGSQRKNLVFEDEKSLLFFGNKEITISKTRNSNGHYLLKTIFKDKDKTWEFDEIAEDWGDGVYEKDDWSRYYNAGYAVNEKVAKETTIKDFLDITSKTVGINKKYL